MKLEDEIFNKLKEAELEAKMTEVRYSHDEIFCALREKLDSKEEKGDV